MFRPPGLLATQVAPTAVIHRSLGSRGVSIRACHASLPPHAPDMLAARMGNWRPGTFTPSDSRSCRLLLPTLALKTVAHGRVTVPDGFGDGWGGLPGLSGPLVTILHAAVGCLRAGSGQASGGRDHHDRGFDQPPRESSRDSRGAGPDLRRGLRPASETDGPRPWRLL